MVTIPISVTRFTSYLDQVIFVNDVVIGIIPDSDWISATIFEAVAEYLIP